MNVTAIVQMVEETAPATETLSHATEMSSQVTDAIQNMSMICVDWNELVYVIVGAVIGFLGSIIVLIVERILDRKGKIQIYYRRINQRGMNGIGWGFNRNTDGGMSFIVPVVFELQNTSNTTRVIRDVSLLLYLGNEFVGKMYQIPEIHTTSQTNGRITGEKHYEFGSEKGSYSFVLPPRSIQRQECEYIFSVRSEESEEKQFDTVVARYFDERNKEHTFRIMTIANAWEQCHYTPDEEWLVL